VNALRQSQYRVSGEFAQSGDTAILQLVSDLSGKLPLDVSDFGRTPIQY
jgi:hypothetical protein